MNFIGITLLACIAAVSANPVNVSNNNIGDIVTVGINANAVLSSQIDQNIFSVIAALLNQQAIGVSAGQNALEESAPAEAPEEVPEPKDVQVPAASAEVVEQLRKQISPELVEKFKNFMKQL